MEQSERVERGNGFVRSGEREVHAEQVSLQPAGGRVSCSTGAGQSTSGDAKQERDERMPHFSTK